MARAHGLGRGLGYSAVCHASRKGDPVKPMILQILILICKKCIQPLVWIEISPLKQKILGLVPSKKLMPTRARRHYWPPVGVMYTCLEQVPYAGPEETPRFGGYNTPKFSDKRSQTLLKFLYDHQRPSRPTNAQLEAIQFLQPDYPEATNINVAGLRRR